MECYHSDKVEELIGQGWVTLLVLHGNHVSSKNFFIHTQNVQKRNSGCDIFPPSYATMRNFLKAKPTLSYNHTK